MHGQMLALSNINIVVLVVELLLRYVQTEADKLPRLATECPRLV